MNIQRQRKRSTHVQMCILTLCRILQVLLMVWPNLPYLWQQVRPGVDLSRAESTQSTQTEASLCFHPHTFIVSHTDGQTDSLNLMSSSNDGWIAHLCLTKKSNCSLFCVIVYLSALLTNLAKLLHSYLTWFISVKNNTHICIICTISLACGQ